MSRAAKPFIFTLDISEVFCYFILYYPPKSQKEIDTMSNYIKLFYRKSFGEIAKVLRKDHSTISREVRKHSVIERSGYGANGYNACVHRDRCTKVHVCSGSCTRQSQKLLLLLTKLTFLFQTVYFIVFQYINY